MVLPEEREFIGPAVVLQHGAGVGLARLGGELLEVRHNARHIHLGGLFLALAIGHKIPQVRQLAVGEVVHLELVAVQRVGAQVHSHQVLFPLQELHDVHVALAFRQRRALRLHLLHVPEQRRGAGHGVVLIKVSVTGDKVDEHLSALAKLEVHAALVAKAVEGAGIHQRLKALAVHAAGHALYKVVNICEQAVFVPFFDDGVHHVGAEALDGAQGKAHVAVLVHGEVVGALVDVRVQHLDAMALAIVHDFGDFLHALGAVEAAGEELRRVMALEPAGLVAHPGVAGGVGLVEGVLGELLPVLPNLVQHLLRMPFGLAARHELVLQGVQNVDLLLTHGLAELVCLSFGETGQLLGQQHHLLLVHRDAVGVLQEFLHFREVVLNSLLAQLTGHKVRNIIHGPGPI